MAPSRPTRPIGRSASTEDLPDKPYELVSFPRKRPALKSACRASSLYQNGLSRQAVSFAAGENSATCFNRDYGDGQRCCQSGAVD